MELKYCIVCGSKHLKKVFSLGKQPLANNLSFKLNQKVSLYELNLNLCKKCYNCQLSKVVNPKKLFQNYLYQSSISQSFIKHFDDSSKKFIKLFNLKKDKSVIIDVGSNDGIGLIPFKKRGFNNLIAIEPAKKLADITKKKKIKTYNCFLDNDISNQLRKKADVIMASNVFAHVKDINNFSKNIFKMLKDDGIFVVEVQYLSNMLLDGSFDNIYHEHLYYWSINALKNFFKKHDAEVFKVEKINTHGGSIRVYVKKEKNKKVLIENSVSKILKEEKINKIFSLATYKEFNKKIYQRKKRIQLKLLKYDKEKNSNIVGFGAPAKATTLINFFNLKKYVQYIIDDNDLKHNKIIPNTNILIFNKKRNEKINCVIVFAWNYFDEIKKNNKHLSKNFINIFKV